MNVTISIDKQKNKFSNFLDISNNSRILFSGKFGTGKTHFINRFFEEKKDLYEVFHLYPINYQISSTENILNLIKYDILAELIKNKDIFETESVDGIMDSTKLFYLWTRDNLTLNNFLQKTISVGEDFSLFFKLGKPLKELLEIDKMFQAYKKKHNAGEVGVAEEFLKEITCKNISEPDYISYLIKEKITKRKGTKKVF